MLDPGLVARARRWGLFASFSSFAFQFNKNVKKQLVARYVRRRASHVGEHSCSYHGRFEVHIA